MIACVLLCIRIGLSAFQLPHYMNNGAGNRRDVFGRSVVLQCFNDTIFFICIRYVAPLVCNYSILATHAVTQHTKGTDFRPVFT